MWKLAAFLSLVFGIASCRSQFDFVNGRFEDLSQRMEKFQDTAGKKWVLLIAGSRFYYNYRHQADVCHAYQIVHKHGIPDEQIVVMMYDDIANSYENPNKGEIINHPDGPNVYEGVPKDYTGDDVTPENFISVLTGKKNMMKGIGSGKVIDSGPNDHVFVFFSDHGAPGLIAFPSDRLYKADLANAITYMHTNKKYQQLVFYIEACESGSMFYNNLADNINVYATTAANRSQSSFACYFDDKRQTYLGDRYSVSWLEDSDQENLAVESLHKQYEITKAATNQSMVMQFGDVGLSKEPVSFFQGAKSTEPTKPLRQIYDDVPAPDVKIHILNKKIETATSVEEENKLRAELNEEYEMRNTVGKVFKNIALKATNGRNSLAGLVLYATPTLDNMSCYKDAVEWFDRVCFDLDSGNYDFAYRKLYVLGNLCDAGIPTQQILKTISSLCK
ncbi:legumain-like [Styela clava]